MNSLKVQLRKDYLKKRNGLSQDNILEKSLSIQNQIINHPRWREAKSVGLYHPILNEVETKFLQEHGLKSEKKIYYPKVNHEKLDFYKIDSSQDLIPGYQNIFEPSSHLLKLERKLNLIIVPGIAFNHHKYRIGYGKGFYDRVLKEISEYSIGICYQSHLINENFQDKWDIPVDEVMTDV